MNSDVILNELEPVKTKKGKQGLRYLWRSDLFRYKGDDSLKSYLTSILRIPGYRYSFFLRLCSYLLDGKRSLAKRVLYRVNYEILRQVGIRYGIVIHPDIRIGPGFYIVNFGGIFINAEAVIGKNCNISQGVVIGPTKRGSRKGCPQLGDNVFVGPGALLVGGIKIGNNACIGGNAVVSRDVPDNAVVVGNPGQIVSYNGSEDYINRTGYE